LGFVGAQWTRRALAPVPRLASPFIVTLRERGLTAIHGRRPRSGRVSDRETDPEIRPEITFLTLLSIIWHLALTHDQVPHRLHGYKFSVQLLMYSIVLYRSLGLCACCIIFLGNLETIITRYRKSA
jgi:hypothetical protein